MASDAFASPKSTPIMGAKERQTLSRCLQNRDVAPFSTSARRSFAVNLVLLNVLVLGIVSGANAATYNFRPTDDVFVRENGNSQESWRRLRTDTTAGARTRSFLLFDASSVTGDVVSATLRLYVHSDSGAFEIVELKNLDTWKDLPGDTWAWDDRYFWCNWTRVTNGLCRSTGSNSSEWVCGESDDCSNSFVEVDVTELVEWDMGNGNQLMFGLQQRSGALELSSNNDNVDATRRPRLTIITGDAQATHGPAVGGVTSRSAMLWLRTGVGVSVDFQLSTLPSMANPQTSPSVIAAAADDFTARVPVNGLQPDTLYYYVPRVNGTALNLNPKPYFRTAPQPGSEQDFTFVVLTDFQSLNANTADERPDTFWSAAGENPAFYIIGGDFDHRNPGANETDLGVIRQATRRMYQDNFDRSLPRRADFVDYILHRGGIAHLWDDHDYCCNDSDEGYVGKHVALATYDEYWPSYPRPAPDQGIYQSWNWGHVQFFLLDGRFHRADSRAYDNGDKTVLGAVQKAWLTQQLRDSDAVWKIVLSGSVFNPTVKCGADNWCDMPIRLTQVTTTCSGMA